MPAGSGEYHKSILAGYKLVKRKDKTIIGKIDGKEWRGSRGAQKIVGQGRETVNFNLSSDAVNKLNDYCKENGKFKSRVVEQLILDFLNEVL